MAPVTGLTVVKQFTYRTQLEEFSNTYHFMSPPPNTTTEWDSLRSAVVSHEATIFPASVHFVHVYGYDSDDPKAHHVYQFDYTTPGPPPPGTFVPTSSLIQMAGDQAALVEWRVDRLNSRGKPIYLRKYFHAGTVGATGGDTLDGVYKAALTAFAGTTGILSVWGGLRSITHPEAITAAIVKDYVTTRTLKRRGKRPVPGT